MRRDRNTSLAASGALTAWNIPLPASSKMVTMVPQNGRWGSTLDYWTFWSENHKNPKWPPGGPKMANGVCKLVHPQIFGRSCQLLLNRFCDLSTPSMRKVDDREKKGKIMIEVVATNVIASWLRECRLTGTPAHVKISWGRAADRFMFIGGWVHWNSTIMFKPEIETDRMKEWRKC